MKKISRILMITALIVHQFGWPLAVWSQNIENTPTPTVTAAPTIVETNDETTTPTPTPTETETTATSTPTSIISETPTPTPTINPDEIIGIELQAPTPEPEATIIVVVSNEATVGQQSDTSADSGNNTIAITPTGAPVVNNPTESTIITDKAIALANIVNAVNTNSFNSNVKIYLLNNLSGAIGQVDLNTAWNLLNSNGNQMNVLTVDTTGQNNQILIDNLGIIQNEVEVQANSGNNQINGGDQGVIFTGNAYALANILNILNVNVYNSSLFAGIINVDGSTLGDIVLPNPEWFLNQRETSLNINGTIDNEALINSQVSTETDSGNNGIETDGSGLIITGNSQSSTNVLTMANMNTTNNNQLLVGLNVLGNWSGNIYNFYGLGTAVNGSSNNWFLINDHNEDTIDEEINTSVNNAAAISNLVLARAMSGQNQITAGNGGVIQTGNDWALANVTNLANLNIFDSNWFYMTINVIGDWGGNVIFAYPDLTLSLNLTNEELRVDQETELLVNYANVGYDDTNDKNQIEIELPGNLQFLNDNSGLPLSRQGNRLIWQVNNMPAKSSRSFYIKVKLNSETAWKLVKTAMAAEATARSEVVVNGEISTTKTEVSTDNNSAYAVAYVNVNGNETTNELLPKLMISEKNNVNNWVYKNDVISFEINAKNEGEATAYNTFLIQKIFDINGKLLTSNKIKLGNVVVGKSGKVTFGLPINFNLNGQQRLFSQTEMTGYSEQGQEIISNISESTFTVKFSEIKSQEENKLEIQATETSGEVLGDKTETKKVTWPYLMMFVTSSGWIIRQTNRWRIKK